MSGGGSKSLVRSGEIQEYFPVIESYCCDIRGAKGVWTAHPRTAGDSCSMSSSTARTVYCGGKKKLKPRGGEDNRDAMKSKKLQE